MNYWKHYELLCERGKARTLNEYIEKHHIIPKCMGGSDDIDNITFLTPEEHYVAHQLLVKMYPNHRGLTWAAIQMTGNSKYNGRPKNKIYGWLRRLHAQNAKKRIGKKNGSYGKTWYNKPGTLENIKCNPEDAPNGWIQGRKWKPDPPNKTCIVCGCDTGSTRRKYCEDHRKERQKETSKKVVDKAKKSPHWGKRKYSDHDIIIAIKKCNNNLEKAMRSLGYVVGKKGNNTWKRFEKLSRSLV